MSSKIYLKAAREAIGKGDWEEAKRQARLAIDSGGGDIAYNGHVFLGLALEKSRGGADWLEAQNSYFAAIQLNEENPLAIQGLCSLYEKIPEKMSEYISTSQKLASLFCKRYTHN